MDKVELYIYPDQHSKSSPKFNGVYKIVSKPAWLNMDGPLDWYERNKSKSDRNVIVKTERTLSSGDVDWVYFLREELVLAVETISLVNFLESNPDVEVLFHRGHLFIKTWID